MPHARPASLVKLALSVFAAAAVTSVATVAEAGCNPACVAPAICRYEAAGGHFYCAEPRPRGGGARMQSRGGRRSSTANQGGATAPNREAPNGARRANPR
ncbi:MAG: hypothetical protein U0325_32625 [Polyangiales bacterium]